MSNVDVTVPVFGNPTTASVRDNFAIIKAELEVLENKTQNLDASGVLSQSAFDLNGGILTIDAAGTTTLQSLLNNNPIFTVNGTNTFELNEGSAIIGAGSSGATLPFNTTLAIESATNAKIALLGGLTATSEIDFGDSGDNDAGRILYSNSSDSMSFWTAGVQAFTISNSQDITMAGDFDISSGPVTFSTPAALSGGTPVPNSFLVLDSSTFGPTIQMLANFDGLARIVIGDSLRNDQAEFRFDYDNDRMEWHIDGATKLQINGANGITTNSSLITQGDGTINATGLFINGTAVTAGAGGGPTVLASGTVSAAQASVDINLSAFTPADYVKYELIFSGIRPTQDADRLELRVSANGTVFDAGVSDYDSTLSGSVLNTSIHNGGSTGVDAIRMTLTNPSAGAPGNQVGEEISGRVTVHFPGQTGVRRHIEFQVGLSDFGSTPRPTTYQGHGVRLNTAAINGLQLLFASDTMQGVGQWVVLGYAA